MKTLHTFFVCAALMMTAACTSDELTDDQPGQFQLVGNILPAAPVSRVQMDGNGEGYFTDKDQNTLFFHDGNATLKTMTYEYGKNYYWYDLGLNTVSGSCKLSACYPVVETNTPKAFKWDVTAHTANPDLLVAAATPIKVNSASPISLTFGHVMHKLAVELSSSESSITPEVLGKARIVLGNYQPVAEVNLFTGATNGTSGVKTNATKTGAKAAFIVPAQSVGNMTVTVSLEGKTKVFNLSDCQISGNPLLSLESGKTFVLNVGVTKGGFVIANQTITGWGDQGSYEGEFEI